MARAVMLVHGDCLQVMPTLDAESVDAIVTDPPAGISFMGKTWDHHKGGRDQWIAWLASVMREGLRVLKPGGHALVWAIPRTSHWTGMALEDAGFEVRDRITHLFGSGFPKSADVSKHLDKAAGEQRGRLRGVRSGVVGAAFAQDAWSKEFKDSVLSPEPITDLARQWDGWGSALKPAAEDWWLARKPLIGTIAANVAARGVGALNIDRCRINPGEIVGGGGNGRASTPNGFGSGLTKEDGSRPRVEPHTSGRWPANVVLSHVGGPEGCREVGTRRVKGGGSIAGTEQSKPAQGVHQSGFDRVPFDAYADADGMETVAAWECAENCAVRMLDAQGGECGTHGGGVNRQSRVRSSEFGMTAGMCVKDGGGSASRFFLNVKPDGDDVRFGYFPKSSRAEREAGLEGMPEREQASTYGDIGPVEGNPRKPLTGHISRIANHHPTVKPLDLMRWLCRLVTPPGGEGREPGLILDPFAGSGTTGCAAALEGLRFLGIERELEYCEIAEKRIAYWTAEALRIKQDRQPDLFEAVG